MFVRWECGCVGLRTDDPRQAIILQPCDEGRDTSAGSLSWFARDQSEKTCAPLEDAKAAQLHTQLARRLALADRFEGLQRALGLDVG